MGATLQARQMLLRCYAEQKQGCWQAFCLDFDLAAQADSFEEARDKLHQMIAEYVYDALAGEDRAYAESLLSRRAPLRLWAKYYAYRLLLATAKVCTQVYKSFKEYNKG